MVADLKATVVNMKTLTQHIDDPVVVNAADAEGRRLRIVFTQEAAAQLAPHTKVYLSWHHQQNNIKGYNVFTELPRENKKQPPAWEIYFPQSMLYCGDVLACIELVDDVSIAASTNFMIHVLEDPNDGVPYIFSDDYSEFQNAVIVLSTLAEQVQEQMEQYQAMLDNLAEVAFSGEAADVATTTATGLTATNVEDALAELNAAIDNAIASNVTIEKITGTIDDDYIYRYIFKQNDAIIENGIIDINKDMVVTSGELVYPSIENPIIINNISITDGTYIKMIIADGEFFYIDVASLIEYNSVQSTDEIILIDTNHTITASVGEVAASKIIYREISADKDFGSITFQQPAEGFYNAYDGDASDIIAELMAENLSSEDIIKVNINGDIYDYTLHTDLSSAERAYLYPVSSDTGFGRILLNDINSDIVCPINWEGGTVTFSIALPPSKETVAEAIDNLESAIGVGGNVEEKIEQAINALDSRIMAPAGSAITGIRIVNGILNSMNTVQLNAQNISYNNTTVSNTLNTIGIIPTAATATTVVNYVDEQVNNALTWHTIS